MNKHNLLTLNKIKYNIPYDIKIYSNNMERKTIMPVAIIDVNSELIPMYISKSNADIKCTYKRAGITTFNNIDNIKQFLVKNFDILLKHWNGHISDKEILEYIRK